MEDESKSERAVSVAENRPPSPRANTAPPPPKEVLVVTHHYDFLLWLFARTADFSRAHRYSLGQRIEENALEILELLVEARASSSSPPFRWASRSSAIAYSRRTGDCARHPGIASPGVCGAWRATTLRGNCRSRRYNSASRRGSVMPGTPTPSD